jgi:hypothetical protein
VITQRSAQRLGVCVMPRKLFTPLSILQRLWSLGAERDAGNVAQLFSSRNQAVEVMRDDVRGVTLHDLVLDFCATRAVELGREISWHRRHPDGYVACLLDASTESKIRNMEDVISYCHASTRVLTREPAPHDWTTTQEAHR